MTRVGCFAALAMTAAASGCGLSHGIGDREPCGPTTCEVGQVCCNASCGICTEPGEACIDIACVDAGTPSTCGGDTCGSGELCCPACPGEPDFCTAGPSCPIFRCPPPRPGCEACGPGELCCDGCFGEDAFCSGGPTCPDLDCPTEPECDDATPCPAGFWCDRGDACSGPGLCEPTPDGCPEDCPGVCGCDGSDYCNECMAAQAGVGVAHTGACGGSTCEGRDYCGCTAGCEPLVDLTPGCICECDDPFNCSGMICDCACGGAQYRGCVPEGSCPETELRCDDPTCRAERGPDGCLVCVCS